LEHFLVFWLLGFLTIVVLAILSKTLIYGNEVGEGLAFLYAEAAVITSQSHALLGNVFLLVAGMMLFSTHLGILESSSRIISENIFLFFSNQKKTNLSFGFYTALWLQIGLGIVIYLVGWQEPRFLLTLSAVLNAAAMMVAFPLVFWLNKKHLPKAYQPHWLRLFLMLAAFIFFVILVGVTFLN
ncbi:MAG: Nramp family divalent metal transporter, partial [Candidatus Paceibacterota bacterium]